MGNSQFDAEEHYLKEDRKAGRRDRKLASAKDRSKYKKTDSDKLKAQQTIKSLESGLLRGRIISIASEGILVDSEAKQYYCVLRGTLKKEKTEHKNLVIVGDFVHFERINDKEGAITYVEPRHSILSRADNLSQRKKQLIAANIDSVLITTCVVNPPLKPSLLDRYIIAADKGGMEAIIVINKIDLLTNASFPEGLRENEKEVLEELFKAYEQAGVPAIAVSSTTGEGMEQLAAAMKDKASVFSGQSGVGKSSLINALTGSQLKTGDIVQRTQKGSHTTSTANLIPLPFGGWCIDTPGIKSFGVWDLQKDELLSYFPEIMKLGQQCKFPNCTHIHEPGCCIPQAVEEGIISPFRYLSYCSLHDELREDHVRR